MTGKTISVLFRSVVLDESGTTELNRKATTGKLAKYFSPGSYSLEYYPLNEG
jgi:hypothetical protein